MDGDGSAHLNPSKGPSWSEQSQGSYTAKAYKMKIYHIGRENKLIDTWWHHKIVQLSATKFYN
jgi:hypothetical protein